MNTTLSAPNRPRLGTLDEFLDPEDIVPFRILTDDEWNTIRRVAGGQLAWRFATLRNLWVHRGRFLHDAIGFAWAGIYRTLLVGSIVATSYRNEGLFRAGEPIQGTGDFFRGGFLLPRSSNEFREIVRLVNLRHHVAGVSVLDTDGGYRVIEGYEADYAYVATAFIEAIRRGLATCGLPSDSPRDRTLGEPVCTVLYQIVGLTGLRRVPRDLAAHERFRDAYDRHLRERPASARVQRMGREIARRIVPVTAALADETVANHIRRHFDPETAAHLFFQMAPAPTSRRSARSGCDGTAPAIRPTPFGPDRPPARASGTGPTWRRSAGPTSKRLPAAPTTGSSARSSFMRSAPMATRAARWSVAPSNWPRATR